MRILAYLTAAVLLPGLAATSVYSEPDQRVTSRTYDPLDRLETETVALEDGGSATVGYTYWNDGRRRTVTDALGRVTFYEYDGRGNLKRVTANQGLPDQHVTAYEYWPDDLLKTITKPNGTVTSYGYDRADRLTSVFVHLGASVLASYAYTYDANGNRLTQVETNGGAPETTTCTYDDLNRLETVAYPDGKTFAYEYDAVGNRTRETERNASSVVVSDKTAAFDAINRLTTITDAVDPAQNATLAWDRNGNLLSKTTATGVEEYSYDARDLMAETRTGASITSRHAYDPFGRRYVKHGLEDLRQYIYDETSTLHELDDDDLEVAKYEYGGDSLLSFVHRNEPRRFYHLDGLGSPTALSDSAGSIVARYHLDAWGRYRLPSELSASANRFGFTGYLFDQETDLYYAKARFYDPEIGRFTSQDSVLGQVGEPPSLNRYFYGQANPLRYLDPTGHCTGEASIANFQDCFTAGLKGVLAPPTNLILNWGSGLAYRATANESFRARAHAFTDTAERVEKSFQSPAHLLTATVEGGVDQLNAFSEAINEGRGADAAEILGGGLAQAPLLAETGGAMRVTPGAALATAEGRVIQASGTMAMRGGSATSAGILMSGNARANEPTNVQENTPSKGTSSPTKEVSTQGTFDIDGPITGALPGQPDFVGPTAPEFRIAPHGQQARPSRPYASHHGVQRKYLEKNVPGYDAKADPTIMLEDRAGATHRRITGEQATERAAVRRETGDPYGGDYGQRRAQAIEQMRRNGVPEAKIGQWVLEHDAYLFELGRKKP